MKAAVAVPGQLVSKPNAQLLKEVKLKMVQGVMLSKTFQTGLLTAVNAA